MVSHRVGHGEVDVVRNIAVRSVIARTSLRELLEFAGVLVGVRAFARGA